jgi:hypothetical protein
MRAHLETKNASAFLVYVIPFSQASTNKKQDEEIILDYYVAV